jgi:predicted sulfurtransferase
MNATKQALAPQTYINLAFYKFVALDDLPGLRGRIQDFCRLRTLRGTILIAPEGINCTIAGPREDINAFRSFLDADPRFSSLPYKESISDHMPFTRMLVKIKKEIIAFGVAVDPAGTRAPAVTAHELKRWLDEGRSLILLDTRNDYEVLSGKFAGAHELKIRTFRKFPEEAKNLPEEWKKKTVVSYCTGGIRCEKAAPLLKQYGFEDVYQLEGGILRYFEEVGGAHFEGECFVFDYRVGVDPALKETQTAYCQVCQFPVTAELQKSRDYVPGKSCPSCRGHR